MKKCSKCNGEKAKDLFSKDKRRPDGLTSWCKKCRSALYFSKRQEILAQQKTYADTNRHARRAYGAKYYKENRQKVLDRSKETYYANAEAIKQRHREYNKVYLQLNKEMSYAKTQRRRARRSGNGVFVITKKELLKLYSAPCFYCEAKKAGHVDHVLPIAKGGRHSIGNLVSACAQCNMSKGAKYLSQWKKDTMKFRKETE